MHNWVESGITCWRKSSVLRGKITSSCIYLLFFEACWTYSCNCQVGRWIHVSETEQKVPGHHSRFRSYQCTGYGWDYLRSLSSEKKKFNLWVEEETARQNAKEGLVSQLKGDLVGMVPLKSRMFPESEFGMSNCISYTWETETDKEVSAEHSNMETSGELMSVEQVYIEWWGKKPGLVGNWRVNKN